MAPEFLEIADEILREAEKTFGDTIDKGILFPLADHISFAVGRIRDHEQISNPLTDDIKVLFYSEFKVAEVLKKILKERMDIEIDDHEVGYVALHIHSALGDEKVSVAMQTARTVRECIAMIEMATGSQKMSARAWGKVLAKSWIPSRSDILPCISSVRWSNKCKKCKLLITGQSRSWSYSNGEGG